MSESRICNLFARRTHPVVRPKTAPRSNRARFAMEDLEGRQVPAFPAPVSYATGGSTGGVAVGDFNGDGRDDMGVVNLFAGSVGALISNADGTFQPEVDYAPGRARSTPPPGTSTATGSSTWWWPGRTWPCFWATATGRSRPRSRTPRAARPR